MVTAKVPEAALKAMAARLDQSMPVGNEGAGVGDQGRLVRCGARR